MKLQTKITLGAFGILTLIIIVLVIVLAVKNKKTKAATPKNDNPLSASDVFDNTTASGSNTKVTDSEVASAEKLAKKLYDDMDGLNWRGHDADIYEEVNLLSDRELSILNAVFNKKYGEGETLIEWLNGESWSWADWNSTLIQSIVARLEKL